MSELDRPHGAYGPIGDRVRLLRENERLRTALLSIACNTCCGPCQEAALVARAALMPPSLDPPRAMG